MGEGAGAVKRRAANDRLDETHRTGGNGAFHGTKVGGSEMSA
jgi:hypothetical protein